MDNHEKIEVPGTFQLHMAEEGAGVVIGRYKLLQKIGEGGMGVVYMAEQTEPVVRRVAFKIIKLGMDTRQVVARFEAERQALALMDHPNIAKVLDAGSTDTGRPYFVMELVHGVPITEYCDKNKLSTQQRLELFIPVCQAIQHAHQKGIIHRDIKPSNVMVTLHDGVPVPKVIDFGVAKATNQRLTQKTLFTNYAQMIGTPAYMSPEQAEMSGLDIDTRSDIYSLGVLLYELLTGTTPFDPKELLSKGYAEMQRIIAEQEPPKPSTRMSTLTDEQRTAVAAQRSTEASSLRKVLQGDLDWIVMKCLEKDRTRRYETSNGLVADIRRHLNNELITARPPTSVYLLGKLIRRNRLAFAAGVGVAACLVVGMMLSSWQAIRARQAERRALATLEELRGTAPAFAEQARALVARSKFDEAITKLDYAIQLQPKAAEYLVSKANLLQCQLKLAEAAEVYRAALQVQPQHHRAKTNLDLSEQLLQGRGQNQSTLSTEHLATLLNAMQIEQRPAAELVPVSEQLEITMKATVREWLERLKDLPIPPDKPLKERLRAAGTGRMTLDLSGTAIADLQPLKGMPLGRLLLADCSRVTDIAPLRGMPLRTLNLGGTGVTNLAPLNEIPHLGYLDLSGLTITNLEPLRGLKLRQLSLKQCKVTDLEPLRGMPLEMLNLWETPAASLEPLRGMPLKNLVLCSAPATDFEVLSGMPLETLLCVDTRIRNLAVLKGMPLRMLSLQNSHEARNYAVLPGITTLRLLMLPDSVLKLPDEEIAAIDALQQLPDLNQIATKAMEGSMLDNLGPKEAFWPEWNIDRAMVTGNFDQARALLTARLEETRKSPDNMEPASLPVLRQLAHCEALAGNFGAAARWLRDALDLQLKQNDPSRNWEELMDWTLLSVTQLAANDHEAYRRTCAETVLRNRGRLDIAAYAEVIARICLFSTNSGVSPTALDEYCRAARKGEPDPYFRTAALKEFRAGNLDKAAEYLAQPMTWRTVVTCRDLMLAMIKHRRGETDEARALVQGVLDSGIASWPPLRPRRLDSGEDLLFLHLFLGEVAAVVAPDEIKVFRAADHGQYAEAERLLTAAYESSTKLSSPRSRHTLWLALSLAKFHLQRNQFDHAAALYLANFDALFTRESEAVTESIRLAVIAPTLLLAGRTNEYSRLCQNVVERYRHTQEPIVARGVVMVCCLQPSLGPTEAEIGDFLPTVPRGPLPEWGKVYSALAENRAGRPEKAKAMLDGISGDEIWESFAAVIQAEADRKLGRATEARKRLAEAQTILAAYYPPPGNPLVPYEWRAWLTLRYLIQETAASIPADATMPSTIGKK
jgi:tetratricopeptide (TPR) repeat protein